MGPSGTYRIPIRRGSIREFFGSDPALKGCWSLDGHARDESGNEKHGTVTGTTVYPAKFHNGYYFNGSSNWYISVGDFIWSGSTTLLAWRKKFTGAANTGVLFTKGNNITWGMRLNADGSVYAVIDNRFCFALPGYSPKFGESGFQAATFNSINSGLTAYAEGLKGVTTFQSVGALRGGTDSVIGKEEAYYFKGIIEEVAIFYRCLSPSEISQYYQWAISEPRKYWFYSPAVVGGFYSPWGSIDFNKMVA